MGFSRGTYRTLGRASRALLLVAALAFAGLLPAGAGGTAAGTAPEQIGEWGPIQSWSTMGKHLIVMPTNKVLVYSTGQNAHVWNPATGAFKPVPATFGDLHCAGHVTLADGSPFVVGGVNVTPFIGIKVAASFDPVTETWTNRKPMQYARWYPTVTTLSDGRVLAVSGTDENKLKATTPEIYDPVSDTWTALTGAVRSQPLYPFMYQLRNGKVYDAAPKAATAYLNVSGSGSWSSGPTSGWDNQSGGCCSESGAMFEDGKIIRSGGGDPAHARTGVVDMNAAAPAWREVEPMAFPRRRHNMVVLSDGSMLAVGGTKVGDDVTQAVLAAERWDPATEQWDTMAAMSVPRMYHSSAVLLPDGSVVTAGGDNPSSQAKLSAQIYKPPYFFKGPRPVITSSPESASYGSTFTVGTDTAGIAKVAIIRPGAATHAIDMNQRYQTLAFSQSGSELSVTAPASGNVAPPGAYMLVVENGNGVPSVAGWIRIGSGAPPPPPPPTAPTANFMGTPTNGAAPLAVTFANTATGSGPMTFAWDFDNDGTTDSTEPNPKHTYTSPGAYSVKLTVTNDVGSDNEVKTAYINVSEATAPTAGFSATPTSGTEPLQVAFTNSSTGSAPMSYQWDFQNDGTIDSTATNPTFTYTSAGTYSVSLAAVNSLGSSVEVKTGYITVNALPPPQPGTTTIFSSEADARVEEATPGTNFGALSMLRVDAGTDPDVESYLRFTVTGSSVVESAKLRLYATTDTANGPAVYTSDSSWTEAGITWSNRPARTTTPTDDKGAIAPNSWVEFDVTSLVPGNGTYTFVVAGTSTDGLNFNSRQATAGLRPELVVTRGEGPPTADFTASPLRGPAPLTVSFTDRSVDHFSTAWDFQNDDSFESTERNPTFTYTAPGTYTVRLQVENAQGGDEEIKVGYIVVDPPVASLTFDAAADARVKSSSPTKNYGLGADLQVRNGTSLAPHWYRSYLKFAVSGLSAPPSSAKLRLYVKDASAEGGIVYAVSNAWTETGLTWSNAPEIVGEHVAAAGRATLGTWKEIDVTKAISGNGTYSFALKEGSSSDSVIYGSRETTTKPQLVIVP